MPKRESAKADAGSVEQGKALLAKAQAAVGGAEKLTALKDMDQTSSVMIKTPQGDMKLDQRIRMVFPATARQEQTLPFAITSLSPAAGCLGHKVFRTCRRGP